MSEFTFTPKQALLNYVESTKKRIEEANNRIKEYEESIRFQKEVADKLAEELNAFVEAAEKL